MIVSRFTFDALRGALLCALLVGCAIPLIPYRSVYEDPVNYVRLERDETVLPEWLPSAHAHPKAMRDEDVSRILGGISVKEHRIWLQRWLQGEAPLVPAFRPEELRLLSRQIAEAFAVAKPDERVTFYLSQPQTSVKRIITTGGLYVHGTELHFILGNWQVLYGIPTYGMIYDRRLVVDITQPVLPPGKTKTSLDADLSRSETSFLVPKQYLEPNRIYEFEVLATEKGGNQTITEGGVFCTSPIVAANCVKP